MTSIASTFDSTSTTATLPFPLTKVFTLVFLFNTSNSTILLAQKKRGFACGKWNGYGGKVEGSETIEQAAVRELEEESGIQLSIDKLDKIAVLTQQFVDPAMPILLVHVFSCSTWTALDTAVETEEMRPQVFNFTNIPFDQMFPDDKLWMQHLLNGERFTIEMLCDGIDVIINYRLSLIDEKELKQLDQCRIADWNKLNALKDYRQQSIN